MLETIREFGLEQLAASAEEDSIRARHAMLFVSLAEQAEDAFFGPGEIAALDRCEAELGNFRAAMDWSGGEGGDPAVGLRLGAALWWLWLRRVGLREGREWLEQGLAQGRPVPTDVQAKALAVAAEIATFQADYERALMRLEESLALYDTIADPFGRARAKFFLGDYYETRGQVDKSDPPLEAALAGFQSLGATGWAGTALHFLATTASLRNEDERSLELAERALHLCREAGFGTGIAMTVGHLGELAIRRGDYAEAERFVREALALRLERDDRYGATIQLTDLARLAAIRDEAENAAWLYGVAAALRLAAGTVVDEAWRDEHDQLIAGLRTSLGNERYEEIWLASHALTPEQAIAEAREVISEQPSSATTSQ
jgi:tetratricopeptide (TPR) repeat protein